MSRSRVPGASNRKVCGTSRGTTAKVPDGGIHFEVAVEEGHLAVDDVERLGFLVVDVPRRSETHVPCHLEQGVEASGVIAQAAIAVEAAQQRDRLGLIGEANDDLV